MQRRKRHSNRAAAFHDEYLSSSAPTANQVLASVLGGGLADDLPTPKTETDEKSEVAETITKTDVDETDEKSEFDETIVDETDEKSEFDETIVKTELAASSARSSGQHAEAHT